jgi:hypothetical protein
VNRLAVTVPPGGDVTVVGTREPKDSGPEVAATVAVLAGDVDPRW